MTYQFDDENLPTPSDDMDFYESAPSTHVELTTGVQPGEQSSAGLEGLSDLLEGLAKGTVTVLTGVQKPPTPQGQIPVTPTAPPSPSPENKTPERAVSVTVNSGSKSNAGVIVASVLGGAAVLTAVALLAHSLGKKTSRPADLPGAKRRLDVIEMVPDERTQAWRQLTEGSR